MSFFLYLFLTILSLEIFNKYTKSSNYFIATLSQLGSYLIPLTAFFLIYHRRLITDFKNFKKENIKIALKNWIIGLSVMIISNLIITTIVGNIATNESLNREILFENPLSSVISMALIGPILEEITFRASFKNAFSKWYTFATFTGLIFGLAHVANFNLLEFLFVIPYGALGFFFAKAFYETDNIYTSILMHITHNTMAVLLILAM